MKYSLTYYPHEILSTQAKNVENFDKNLHTLLHTMKKIMKEKKGVGIAAPQVGASLRCFFVKKENEFIPFINPVITEKSVETSLYEEGCLSIPGVYADVERPIAVTINAYDENGTAFTLKADDFLARVIQHEFDHLEGILFLDRISRSARKLALKRYQHP